MLSRSLSGAEQPKGSKEETGGERQTKTNQAAASVPWRHMNREPQVSGGGSAASTLLHRLEHRRAHAPERAGFGEAEPSLEPDRGLQNHRTSGRLAESKQHKRGQTLTSTEMF